MRAATIVAAPIRLQYFLIAYFARNVVKMAVRCDEDIVKSVISRCIQKLRVKARAIKNDFGVY